MKNKQIGKLLIIGGYSGDIQKHEVVKLKYMYNKNVYFYARTKNELKMYKIIGNYITGNNIASKSRFGGDLIANNTINILENMNINKSKSNIKTKRVGILSLYLFEYCFENYINEIKNFIKKLDKIILIDTYTSNLTQQYLNNIGYNKELIIINNTEEIINTLFDAKVVVSTRLHGGLISILMNIPTYFLPSDNSKNYECFIPEKENRLGSFKYHCLSQLYNDEKVDFCKIINIENVNSLLDSNIFYKTNTKCINKYIDYTKNLLNYLLSYIE